MVERTCLVLLQHRETSAYNDFVGRFYHFPKKYLNLLSEPDNEFVYYEPSKGGAGEYFGCGTLGQVFPDKKETDHFYIEIKEYHPFTSPVAFKMENGDPREHPPFYNAQNAVRHLSRPDYDGICLDGGVKLFFRADAHLIKVLGEELIANERVGLLELIKNSYDAGATNCTVTIEQIPTLSGCDPKIELVGPIITITDNGRGMSRQIIEYGWLRPASVLKTNVKEEIKRQRLKAESENTLGTFGAFIAELKRANGGRIPLGEKGVGRFAANRLGRFLEICTKTKTDSYEYRFTIDWNEFETGLLGHVDLSKIGVSLYRQPPSRDYGTEGSGTQLRIWGGKEGFAFSKEDFLELRDSISILKSPYRGAENFDVNLVIPQMEDEMDESPVYSRIPPTFEFAAIINEDGIADYEIKFSPPAAVALSEETVGDNNFDLKKMDASFWKPGSDAESSRKPKCGTFYLGLKAWYRRSPWIEGPDAKQMLSYLDSYGGISVFRDGLNILPASWGSKHDWLNLSTRHIKKGLNISYYSFIGACDIDQGSNYLLVDKTDRQGLLENQAFKDLAKLTQSAVLLLENYYKAKRDTYENLTQGIVRDPKTIAGITRESANVFEIINNRYDFSSDTLELFPDLTKSDEKQQRIVNLTASLRNLQKSISALEEVQELLTEQAGFGLAVAVSVHEIAKIAGNFYNGLTRILQKKTPDREALARLKETSQSLKAELKRFGPLRAVRSERSTEFTISQSIDFALEVFESTLEKNRIGKDILIERNFPLYARYGVVNQVISNLIDNSCYWMQQEQAVSRKFAIKTIPPRCLLIADNGPDVDPVIRPYLFNPGYSLKVPPSGLGLYICKHYMSSIGGSIYEASPRDRDPGYKGAQFVLDFSKVPLAKEDIK